MSLFDIPTIYLLTGVSSVFSSGILLWLCKDHRDSGPALALFAGGILALGAGFVCFGVRDALPGASAALLGYAGFGISVVLYWLGSAAIFGARPRTGRAAAAFAAYLVVFAPFTEASADHAQMRIVLSSGFMAVFTVLSALQAHRSQWIDTLRSVRLMRNLMLGYAAIITVRMVAFVLQDISLQVDGTASPGTMRLMFSLVFGSVPFALTVTVLSIANSQLSSELRRIATTDDLTGLVARRSLHEAARRLLEQSPSDGRCIAVLMIDLDDFKQVNDRHGHTLGDEVLRHVAQVLRRVLRDESLIVRYGGDEFCALVPVAGEATAFVVAERLRLAVEASPYAIGRQAIPVTLSIGVTVHRSGATLRQLFDEADRRAYRAKASGRNRVVGDDAVPAPSA